MGATLIALAVLVAALLLFGSKVASLFGFVVACATFSFPLGLIGMVGMGVSLLFLFGPRHYTD